MSTSTPSSTITPPRTGRPLLGKGAVKSLLKAALPKTALRRIALLRSQRRPAVGKVRMGSLRRVRPIARDFGMKWGQPIDRYYIENFLTLHGGDVRGRVLELQSDDYTRRFGAHRVTQSDILDLTSDNPRATIVADLTDAPHVPADTFDCIILTQTLHLIYDLRAAVATLHRILKPGGVILGTVPGIAQIARYDKEHWGEYWRFTDMSLSNLFREFFPGPSVTVEVYGNVLAAVALLHGLNTEELTSYELDHRDDDFQLILTLRAVKGPSLSP